MSDGPNDIARADREASGERRFPSMAEYEGNTADLDARAAAIGRAVRLQAGLIDAAKVLLALAGVAAKNSGMPLGVTAAAVADIAIDMARREAT